MIVLFPVNDGQTGVGECISSTFHMKAGDVMRGRQLFETSQQPRGFDLRGRPSAGVMFFLSRDSLTVHINPFFPPLSSSKVEKGLRVSPFLLYLFFTEGLKGRKQLECASEWVF